MESLIFHLEGGGALVWVLSLNKSLASLSVRTPFWTSLLTSASGDGV